LSGADFGGADLNSALLTEANLRGAYLMEAHMSEAELQGADLYLARLSGARLRQASLNGAQLIQAGGPSVLDHRTLMRSGRLPLLFSADADSRTACIEYLPSLVATGLAIRFYSCFISYSTKDQDFADRLHADLQNKGVRCWFASHDIQAGRKVHEQIDEAIRVYDRLLLILSPASMNSAWVQREIRQARKREAQEKRRVLFPVRLVDFDTIEKWQCFDPTDLRKDLALEIKEYFIPDFSRWKTDHDIYSKALGDLLRDLKATELPRGDVARS